MEPVLENLFMVAISFLCYQCYYLGKIIGQKYDQESLINENEFYKRRAEVDSLRARYFRKVLKLHKINFVEHPTQEDLDNVLSKIDLQKQSESDENNEA